MVIKTQKIKTGLTPLGEALIRVEKVLDGITEPDTLLVILKEIRKEETVQFKWVPGYAGGLKAVRIEQ